MTDQHAPEPDDARAEAALQQAFGRVDHVDDSTRIDPGAVRRRATSRSRLKVGGSTLAVLLVAGGVVGGAQLWDDDAADSAPSSGKSSEVPPDGMRFDYYRDVRVTVPASWAYDSEPGSDWCASVPGGMLPTKPYLDMSAVENVLSIGCPQTDGDDGDGEFSSAPPTDMWVTHLTVTPIHDDANLDHDQYGDWWVLRERLGDVDLKAVSKDRAEAQAMLDAAVVVEDGASGCATHGAIQDSQFPRPEPAFDVTSLDSVDAIRVCQYDGLNSAEDGLAGVATINGPEANAVLHAIQQAPAGGGPDRPDTCIEEPGFDAIELQLIDGDDLHTMFVFYSTCRGNGFDDGTTIRELTKEACMPLIVPPVHIWGGSSASVSRCMG